MISLQIRSRNLYRIFAATAFPHAQNIILLCFDIRNLADAGTVQQVARNRDFLLQAGTVRFAKYRRVAKY
jgi:hypothetical protein